MRKSLLLVLLCCGLWAAPLRAAEPTVPVAEVRQDPIDISAERMEAAAEAQQISFIGQVVARQDDLTIYADTLTLYYRDRQDDIDRIEAVGGVRIVQEERVVTGEKAVYYHAEGRLVLTGSPTLHQGQDLLSGDEIIVFLHEERSIVKSRDGSRVRAVFHPRETKP